MQRFQSKAFRRVLAARKAERRAFSVTVRRLLRQRRWTNSELADRLGVTRQAVGHWVAGSRGARPEIRAIVARLARGQGGLL